MLWGFFFPAVLNTDHALNHDWAMNWNVTSVYRVHFLPLCCVHILDTPQIYRAFVHLLINNTGARSIMTSLNVCFETHQKAKTGLILVCCVHICYYHQKIIVEMTARHLVNLQWKLMCQLSIGGNSIYSIVMHWSAILGHLSDTFTYYTFRLIIQNIISRYN